MKVHSTKVMAKSASEDNSLASAINLEAIHRICIEAVDSTQLVNWYLVELSALFDAIQTLDADQFSSVTRLAELGKHLCDDWTSTANHAHTNAASEVEKLHSILYSNGEKHV